MLPTCYKYSTPTALIFDPFKLRVEALYSFKLRRSVIFIEKVTNKSSCRATAYIPYRILICRSYGTRSLGFQFGYKYSTPTAFKTSIFQSIRYYAKGQGFYIFYRVFFCIAINKHAIKLIDLSDPTTVFFSFKFNC